MFSGSLHYDDLKPPCPVLCTTTLGVWIRGCVPLYAVINFGQCANIHIVINANPRSSLEKANKWTLRYVSKAFKCISRLLKAAEPYLLFFLSVAVGEQHFPQVTELRGEQMLLMMEVYMMKERGLRDRWGLQKAKCTWKHFAFLSQGCFLPQMPQKQHPFRSSWNSSHHASFPPFFSLSHFLLLFFHNQ